MKKALWILLFCILFVALTLAGVTVCAFADSAIGKEEMLRDAVSADDVIYSGTFGELSWILNQTTGKLVISGNGEMGNLSSESTSAWRPYKLDIKSVVIEEGVSSIGVYAFGYCSFLESISLPEGLTSIGAYAFTHCESLVDINLPDSLLSVGSYAFSSCVALAHIALPEGATTVGLRAFYGCSGLLSVSFPTSMTSMPAETLMNCSSLESLTLPYIGEYREDEQPIGFIFGYTDYYAKGTTGQIYVDSMGHQRARYYYIPDTLRSVTVTEGDIPTYAFYNCSFLTSITVQEGIMRIGSHAFANCSGIESIVIPDSVVWLGNCLFEGCSSLQRITLPFVGYDRDSCEPFGYVFGSEFEGSVWVGQQYIPKSKEDFVSYSCYFPAGLREVVVTDDEEIAAGAFSGCTTLESVILPAGVTSIGEGAFRGCSNLPSIWIGKKVVSIGYDAFSECTALNIVRIDSPSVAAELTYNYAAGELIYHADVVLVEKSIENVGSYVTSFLHWEEVSIEGTDYISYSMHKHKWVDCSVERVACVQDGFAGARCKTCSLVKGGLVKAHRYVESIFCDEEYHWRVCADCGEICEKAAHHWNEGVATTPATHLAAGEMTYSCDGCELFYTEVIARIEEHNYGEWIERVEPGCLTAGVVAHYHCECGLDFDSEKNLLDELSIPALGHYVFVPAKEWVDSYTVTNDGEYPFTQADGWYASTNQSDSTSAVFTIGATYDCTLVLVYKVSCEETYDELWILHNGEKKDAISGEVAEKSLMLALRAGDVVQIKYVKDENESGGADTAMFKIESCTQTAIDIIARVPAEDVEPTCAEAVVCACCKLTIKDALAHTAGETVVENRIEPTCGEVGHYDNVVYCSVCSKEIERVRMTIPTVAHTSGETVVENMVESTCTQEGSCEEVVYCAVCGAELSREKVTLPVGGHTYGATVTAPTCTTQGYTTYTCHCGDVYVADYVDPLGCQWGEPVVENSVAPTCTAEGHYDNVVYCTVCGEEQRRERVILPLLDHTKGEWITESLPTCTEDGRKHQICAVCGEELMSELISAFGHTEGEIVIENNVAPTCTDDGSFESVVYCTVCEEEISREFSVEFATGHVAGEWIEDSQPTCTEEGSRHQICEVCSASIATEAIPAVGHKEQEWIKSTSPTCTEEGHYDRTVSCSRCNEELSRELVVYPALGHTEGEWVVDTYATCTEDGSKHQICAVCGETVATEVMVAPGHIAGEPEKTIIKAPTCSEVGSYVDVVYCTGCGVEMSRVVVASPATGHTWGEWVVSTPATCAKVGAERRDCEECGSYETREIASPAHEYANGRCVNCGRLNAGAAAGTAVGTAAAAGGGLCLVQLVRKRKRLKK